jgi:WD40 repeat protein
VTADGKRVVSASRGNTLSVRDLETDVDLGTVKGRSGSVHRVAVTPDGKRMLSAPDDRTLKVWNLETGLPIATFHCDAATFCCAFADDRRIVVGDWVGRVYFLALEE